MYYKFVKEQTCYLFRYKDYLEDKQTIRLNIQTIWRHISYSIKTNIYPSFKLYILTNKKILKKNKYNKNLCYLFEICLIYVIIKKIKYNTLKF